MRKKHYPLFYYILNTGIPKTTVYQPFSVFSLTFSLAGKGPFMAGKAKNMWQRNTSLGGGGSEVRDMALTLL